MVSKAEKLFRRLQATRRGFSSDELAKILRAENFEAREGPHTMYRHRQFHDIQVNVPRTQNVPPVYPQRVLQAVQRARARTQGETQ